MSSKCESIFNGKGSTGGNVFWSFDSKRKNSVNSNRRPVEDRSRNHVGCSRSDEPISGLSFHGDLRCTWRWGSPYHQRQIEARLTRVANTNVPQHDIFPKLKDIVLVTINNVKIGNFQLICRVKRA